MTMPEGGIGIRKHRDIKENSNSFGVEYILCRFIWVNENAVDLRFLDLVTEFRIDSFTYFMASCDLSEYEIVFICLH